MDREQPATVSARTRMSELMLVCRSSQAGGSPRPDETRGRNADLAYENTQDFLRTHPAEAGLRFDRQVGVGMLWDPGLEASVSLRPLACPLAAQRLR
jgi:hypothetical protein